MPSHIFDFGSIKFVPANHRMLREWPKDGPKVLWRIPVAAGSNHPSVAGDDLCYSQLEDSQKKETVKCIDANTGKELWSRQIAPASTQGIDEQLAAYHGTIYVSTVPIPSFTKGYTGGGMGIIYALNEQDGSQQWSFNTVQHSTLWGNARVNSGGGAWYPPAIDPGTGMTYWGTGNPAPFPGTEQYPNGSSRPGPNLYTDSELALTASGPRATTSSCSWRGSPATAEAAETFTAPDSTMRASSGVPWFSTLPACSTERGDTFAAPEGAACLPALRKLIAQGKVTENETVVIFNTGSGIKYLEAFG